MFHFRTVYLIFICIAIFFILSFFKRREIIFRKALMRRKGIVLHSLFHTAIAYVGVYLRCIKLRVAEYLFERKHVHTAFLVHERCRCVAQLMRGKVLV